MLPPASLTASSLFILAFYATLGNALRLPARATPPRRAPSSSRGIKMSSGHGARTGAASGYSSASGSASGSSGDTTVEVENFNDFLYKVDVSIGGKVFTVQMDTGSADLWIMSDESLDIRNKTNIVATETYGQGQAKGPVMFADFQLGGYNVPHQAFIKATSAKNFNFFKQGAVGILGLSFDDVNLSPINAELKRAWGEDTTLGMTPLTNLFTQNPKTPNSFDILLERSSDLDDEDTGTFLIAEHLEGFEHVTAQPKLTRQSLGRWSILLDSMKVNGKTSTFGKSSLPHTPKGKLAVLMDTGFTFPPLPSYVVDTIYSSIPGAVKHDGDSFPQWFVPCNAAPNVSFTFGGIEYPVHPLDLTFLDHDVLVVDGKETNVTYCYNTFQYGSADGTLDGIMGDSFLRNVYASFDYGEGESTGKTAFMQMLPITNLDEALPEFRNARAKALSVLPPAINPAKALKAYYNLDDSDSVASGAATSAPSESGDSESRVASLLDKYGPIVLGLLAGNLLLMTILCIIGFTFCVRGCIRGGAKTRSVGSTYVPVRFKDAERPTEGYHD